MLKKHSLAHHSELSSQSGDMTSMTGTCQTSPGTEGPRHVAPEMLKPSRAAGGAGLRVSADATTRNAGAERDLQSHRKPIAQVPEGLQIPQHPELITPVSVKHGKATSHPMLIPSSNSLCEVSMTDRILSYS